MTTLAARIEAPPEPLISLRNVDHTYGSGELARHTLQGVSLDIMPGEVVILTGPSGSGKTTLLTLCGALRSVQAGSVRTLGCELKGATLLTMQRIREKVGVIFQGHNLLGGLTATQNVSLSLGLEPGMQSSKRTEMARSMLEAVSLGKHFDHYPDQLSGGQKQRVAIARALVRMPQVVLADEPTASLDRTSGREVIDLIRSLAFSSNSAVLLVTHDTRILDIADRIVTLDDGRLVSFASSMATSTGNVLHAFAHLQGSGDLLKHISSLSPKQFLELLDNMTTEFRQYIRVFQIGSRDAVQTLFDAVLDATTVKMVEIMRADRGTIYLIDDRMECCAAGSQPARAKREFPSRSESVTASPAASSALRSRLIFRMPMRPSTSIPQLTRRVAMSLKVSFACRSTDGTVRSLRWRSSSTGRVQKASPRVMRSSLRYLPNPWESFWKIVSSSRDELRTICL